MEVKGKLITKSFEGEFHPRTSTWNNPTTITIDADGIDLVLITGVVGAITIQDPTNTPYSGQKLRINITADASYAITWGAAFRGDSIILPVNTLSSTLYLEFEWNASDSFWDLAQANSAIDGGSDIYAESITGNFGDQVIEGISVGPQIDHRVETRSGRNHLIIGDPYIAPTFSSFSISTQPTTLEAGQTIAGGIRPFSWSTTTPNNLTPNDIDIIDITGGSTVLASGLANDGTENVDIGTSKQLLASQTYTFQIKSGQLQGGDIARNFTVVAYWAVYFGNSLLTTLTESDVEALTTKELRGNFNKTYSLPATGYKWICYPTTYGTATTFFDTGAQQNVAMNDFGGGLTYEIVSLTNLYGQTVDYKCHRTLNPLSSSINIAVS